jgi:general secretion pathway protein D
MKPSSVSLRLAAGIAAAWLAVVPQAGRTQATDPAGVAAPPGTVRPFPPVGPGAGQSIPPMGPDAAQSPPPGATGGAAQPIPSVASRGGEVVLNFQGADLQQVVKAISQMTGRNLLIDPRVRGQFTIFSARPMPVSAAYQVFLSALKAQGFTAVDGPGDVVRIIPVAEAKASAPVSGEETPRGGEQIVTHVVVGQHVAVSQLQNVLRPLMSPTSQLSVYDPANALVITDYADNVRRLLRIIERIDLPATTEVTVIALQNASAIDVGEMVVRLSGSGVTSPAGVPGVPQTQIAAGGDRFTVAPDTRTNSLLIRSDNPGRIAQLRALIEKLDVPARAIGSTRVIYLRHAEAPKLVEVLRGMVSAAAAGAPQAAPGARPGGPTQSLVQADEATNSIIINASDTVYNNLRTVIEQLDIRRAQVYVEALIVEMSADRTDELGIQWVAAGQVGSRGIAGGTNFPTPTNPGIVAAAAGGAAGIAGTAGLVVGVLGQKVQISDGNGGTTTIRNLGALARALESRSLGNILSTPNLLTLDNYQAKIIVGQNVPIVTGSFAQATAAAAGGATAVNPFQTIDRRDVGLTLRIKPQISEGGAIRMEIYQEVSSVDPTSKGVASDVILTKRALETKVVVDDGQTIVLGGLIQNNVSETVQQVPFLGSIPILGALFRYRQEIRSRTNLMIFLRPQIIRTADDGYKITTDRYDYLRAYTRGDDAEREAIYDRQQPVAPDPSRDAPPPRPAERSFAPLPGPAEPQAAPAPAPAAPSSDAPAR